MKLLHLAWRNVLRNRRRSANTIIAISVGLAALVFIWGFIDGMNEQTIENNTSYLTGHLKIHKTGFHADKALYLAMPRDPVVQARLNDVQHVVAVAPRIEDQALLSGDKEARGVKVIGIDPALEPKVTTIAKAIVAGRYLLSDDENTILLGDNLAARAGLQVGDQAVLVTQARDGSLAADRYTVVGLYNSGIDMIDASHVFIPLAAAQELYSLWGQITEWAVRIDERKLAGNIATQLAADLGAGFEVLSWQQLLPGIVQMVRFHEVMTYIVIFIVVVVVAVGVANTILMGVMERTREFGVMLALGTSQRQIIQVVLLESLLLGIMGLLLGLFLGLGITFYYGTTGIDLTQYTLAMETMPGLSGNVYPLIRWDHVLVVSSVTLLISILPAFYPAWQVSRLQPVEAIRGAVKTQTHKPTRAALNRTALSEKTALSETTALSGKTALSETTALSGKTALSRFPFWRIAFRSIWRNPRRSALTSAATAFGLGAFLFLYAFTDGFFEQMINNSIDFSTSHVQIEPQGYRAELSPALFISQPQAMLAQALQHPAVIAAAPRIQVEAMISSPTQTEPLLLTGVDASLEPQVTRLNSVMIEGRYLQTDSAMDIVLGQKLVDELGVRLGEKVVVTTQLADASLGSAAYRLVGIYQTDNALFDRTLAFIGLQPAQALLAMPDSVSTITLRLRNRELSQQVAEELNQGLSNTNYQAQSWQQIMPVLVQMVDVSRLMFYMVIVIVFFVVAIGVANTLFMSVLERTREFGVMLAVGTEPRFIVRMVVYEAVILGLMGIFLGLVLGILLVAYYRDGMDLSSFAGATGTIPGLTDVIYPVLMLSHLWLPTVLLFVTGMVAAFFPAARAARLEPVTAIRHV